MCSLKCVLLEWRAITLTVLPRILSACHKRLTVQVIVSFVSFLPSFVKFSSFFENGILSLAHCSPESNEAVVLTVERSSPLRVSRFIDFAKAVFKVVIEPRLPLVACPVSVLTCSSKIAFVQGPSHKD